MAVSRAHRFDRQFKALARAIPALERPLAWLRAPGGMWIRLPVAVLFILAGFLAILPVFGLWMIPVGLMLLAVDFPWLQGPVRAALVRGRRRIGALRRRWQK